MRTMNYLMHVMVLAVVVAFSNAHAAPPGGHGRSVLAVDAGAIAAVPVTAGARAPHGGTQAQDGGGVMTSSVTLYTSDTA